MGAEFPAELTTVTVTLPIAVLSPFMETGITRFWNMLPTSCDAVEL
jgi:hypothetical protein